MVGIEQFKQDYYRKYATQFKFPIGIARCLESPAVKWALFYRLHQNSPYGSILRTFSGWKLHKYNRKYGLEIYSENIGSGFYIGHPHDVTINKDVVIGKNCNVHKGVTIGAENRGIRKGAPTIGNNVWIGVNATVVGKIKVGDDVLIAPNTYVNCDIPSHSLAFGNPCVVKEKDFATEDYITNIIID